jgi:hypothetical protein
MKVNVYDFDDTIYKGDSGVGFYLYMFKKRFFIVCLYTLKALPVGILFLFKKKDTKDIKDKLFGFIKHIPNIDNYVKSFWDKKQVNIKKWYLEQKKDNDVIITANYDFLIKEICKRLNIKNLIATEYDFKNYKIKGMHSKGENKLKLFSERYPDYIIDKTYSDSRKDIPLLRAGHPGYVVIGDKLIEYKEGYFK